jgi:hypothetical protein
MGWRGAKWTTSAAPNEFPSNSRDTHLKKGSRRRHTSELLAAVFLVTSDLGPYGATAAQDLHGEASELNEGSCDR